MKIINGVFHSPYFIFIKNLTEINDLDILNLLDLKGYVQENDENISSIYNEIYLAKVKDWIHIMDNFSYDHWLSKKFRENIEELGKYYEIFNCSVGNIDSSFEFSYYKNGKKAREYVVESPHYEDEIVTINFGHPLEGEIEGLKKEDQLERVIYIAKSQGIVLPQNDNEIKCYGLLKTDENKIAEKIDRLSIIQRISVFFKKVTN